MTLNFSDLTYDKPNFGQLHTAYQKLMNELRREKIDEQVLFQDFESYSNLYLESISMYHLYLLKNALHNEKTDDVEFTALQDAIFQAEIQLNTLFTLIADLNASMADDSLENTAILNQARRIARTMGKVNPTLLKEERQIIREYAQFINQMNVTIEAEKPAFYADLEKGEQKNYKVNIREFEVWLKQAKGKTRTKLYNLFSSLLQSYSYDNHKNFARLIELRKEQAKQCNLTYFDYLYEQNKGYGYSRKDLISFKQHMDTYFVPLVHEIKDLREKRFQNQKNYFFNDYKINKINPVNLICTEKPIRKVFLEAMENIFRDTESDVFNTIKEDFWSADVEAFHCIGKHVVLLPYWNRLFLFLMLDEDYINVEDVFNQIGKALADLSGLMNLKGITTYEQPSIIREVSGMAMQFLSMRQYHLFAEENHEVFRDIFISQQALRIPLQLAVDTFESTIYDDTLQNKMDFSVLWKQIEKNYNIDFDFVSDGFFSQGHRWQLLQSLFEQPFSSLENCIAFIVILAEQPHRDKRNSLENKLNQLLISNTDLPFVKRLEISGFSSPFEENTIRRAAFALCEFLRL